ncbi:MAG: FAD-dependent oxidoreductase, partial [Alistipes sp.]|nr:FAD-dependent oxidoreductase [Alistipes sp.]
IDATGTGEIGWLAGAPEMYGRDGRSTFGETIGAIMPDNKVQRCTWMYISQRLRPDAILPWRKLKSRGMVEDDLNVWVREEHVGRKAGIYLHWGATTVCEDTRDPVAIAEAQRNCLETLLPDAQTLHEAGFQMHLAPKLGVREVRRIQGEYVLTVNDMKLGRYPEDTIAYTSYGLDPWGENIPKEERGTKPHGIPYRCLIPLGVEGLLMAGKSISGTHLAASGYRVQPIVASIGQAAGTAAAMAVKQRCSVRDVDVKKLRESLTRQGVFRQKQE